MQTRRAMQHGDAIDTALTSTLMDLAVLERTDVELPGLHRDTRDLHFAVGRLLEELEDPRDREEVRWLTERAVRAVRVLVAALDGVDSDDRRTRERLGLVRDDLAELGDALYAFERDVVHRSPMG